MSRPKINIEDLFELKGAVIYNPDSFCASSSVSTDTRTIKKNSIFVALKGSKFDGHNFVAQAVKDGAAAVVINKNKLKNFDDLDVTIVTVPDTTEAYGELANIYRNKLKTRVIAITGSNGKTTTKEILFSLLSKKYRTVRTAANNNNHIGVPLTIFSADSQCEALILELGTNHFGEIKYTAAIAQADFAVITNIGASHLEYLKDAEGVAVEKMALYEETLKSGGKIFVNNDDPLLREKTKKLPNKITFGFKGKCDVKGRIIGSDSDGYTKIAVSYGDSEFEAKLSLPGRTNAFNFLAAAALALQFGLSPEDIMSASNAIAAVDKRMNIVKFKSFSLINDTYNANPESMKSAFEFMKASAGKNKKIAVLGDMFELGDSAADIHRELSASIIKAGIQETYTIGKLMSGLNEELVKAGKCAVHFRTRKSLENHIKKISKENSLILLKGSRGMKMEEFLQYFKD